MFNTYYLQFQKWVALRSKREKLFLLFAILAVLYFFWYFLFTRPLLNKQRAYNVKITELEAKIKVTQEEINSIVKISTNPVLQQKLAVNQLLIKQAHQLKANIESALTTIVPNKNFPLLMRELLNQHMPNVTLQAVKLIKEEPLITPDIDVSNVPALLNKPIFKYTLLMQITSDYFHTISFLTKLESLKWHLYWDSIEYRVTAYPLAEVTLKFYVLVDRSA